MRQNAKHIVCTACVGVISFQPLAGAQTSTAAGPIVAGLHLYVDCGTAGEEERPAAAIIFGFRGDTLLAVTANHAVRSRDPECRVANVHIITREPAGSGGATVRREFDERRDIAVVGAHAESIEVWNALRRVQGIRGDPGSLYLFGCPAGGTCFDEPLQVRIRRRDSTMIAVQSPLLEEGYSGGAAVDGSGQIVGMTLDYGGQNARVLPWDVIERWLVASGYVLNVPPRPIDALGRWLFSLGSDARGSRDSNGRRVAATLVLRAESWDSSGFGSSYGVERRTTSLNYRCESCADQRTVVGTIAYLGSAGFGYAPRNKAFRLIGSAPVSAGFVGNVLFGGSQQLIGRQTLGMVDFQTGQPLHEYFRSPWNIALGVRAEGVLNVGLSGGLGLRLGLYYMSLSGLESTFSSLTAKWVGAEFGLSYRTQ